MDNFSNGGLRIEENDRLYKKYGLTLAKVTNISDPEKLNRVTCKPVCDESDKDVLETDWCHVVTPMSGKLCGQFFIPSVGDLVLLAYLNADPQSPYVIGGTWNEESAFPYTIEDGKNHNYSIKTPTGSEFLLYDEADKQAISLKSPKGTFLLIDDENEKAALSDKAAENTLIINWKDKMIDVSAAESIGLTCGSYSITLNKSGDINITGKTINIKGTDINIEASNGFAAKGATADVEATGKITLKGASADLKGSAGVNIN